MALRRRAKITILWKLNLLLLLGVRLASAAQIGQDILNPPSGLRERLTAAPLQAERRAAVSDALKGRNYGLAEEILLGDIDRSPKSQPLFTLLAEILFLDGKYLECAIALKKAEAIAPLDDRSRFTLAMAYIALEKRDWARPELEKLAAADPRNALYPYWLSRLDYNDMRLESAAAHAQKAIVLDPRSVKAYDNLGLCNEALGKNDEAIGAYRQAIRLNREQLSRSPWPSMNLGALLLKLGRFDEAGTSLRESLNEDPRFPKAHFQLGLLLEKQAKLKEAAQELKQAVDLDPTFAEPCYALGRVYSRMGDEKSAKDAFQLFQQRSQVEKQKNVSQSH
ncbi:MAG: tetratricopeptide repeat protein [Terriglobia bacterium]